MVQAQKIRDGGGPLIFSYMDKDGKIAVQQVADGFGMSKTQLAETAGLARETLYRPERSRGTKTQSRIREMLEIIGRVTEWAGGKEQAMAWYRAQPLPAFGGRTAEALVKDGKAAAVRDYLDHMALGGFA
ncbi:MbcA/ParS/Xre antitoxin family protein [Ensifer aridi]|uniref:MbcA/ParS/Xre antitoxin family protein n=1 Tax=Ensifer aridi TaxID=1708715 RepID=UPI00047AE008|nr:MbcA/ParS/Xre antitoxin family protein [Ensifer aridi]